MLNLKEFRDEMIELVTDLKSSILDDYRAPGDEDSDEPSMQLTIGAASNDMREGWSFQTGDNSYSGGAYSYAHWAVVSLTRDCDPSQIADDIANQLMDRDDFDFDLAD